MHAMYCIQYDVYCIITVYSSVCIVLCIISAPETSLLKDLVRGTLCRFDGCVGPWFAQCGVSSLFGASIMLAKHIFIFFCLPFPSFLFLYCSVVPFPLWTFYPSRSFSFLVLFLVFSLSVSSLFSDVSVGLAGSFDQSVRTFCRLLDVPMR